MLAHQRYRSNWPSTLIKVTIAYYVELVATSSIFLRASCVVTLQIDVSAATGSNGFILGAECGYDTAKSVISKYTAAVGYSTTDFVVSAILADKASTLKVTRFCVMRKEVNA